MDIEIDLFHEAPLFESHQVEVVCHGSADEPMRALDVVVDGVTIPAVSAVGIEVVYQPPPDVELSPWLRASAKTDVDHSLVVVVLRVPADGLTVRMDTEER